MAHEKAFAIGLGMDISKGPRIGSWQKTTKIMTKMFVLCFSIP
jgi:hypothetical protein